jgi:hypothetical protein
MQKSGDGLMITNIITFNPNCSNFKRDSACIPRLFRLQHTTQIRAVCLHVPLSLHTGHRKNKHADSHRPAIFSAFQIVICILGPLYFYSRLVTGVNGRKVCSIDTVTHTSSVHSIPDPSPDAQEPIHTD